MSLPDHYVLFSSMSTQAICRPKVELYSIITSDLSSLPLVRTLLMNRIISEMTDNDVYSIPGTDLLTLFCNSKYNYEDSVIVHAILNDRGIFSHSSLINHPVPEGAVRYYEGTIISEQNPWWRPSDPGTVISEGSINREFAFAKSAVDIANAIAHG